MSRVRRDHRTAHGDGNIIWDEGRCSIVDFEDAGRGDPAYELADLIEHVTVSLRRLLDPDRVIPAIGFTPTQLTRYETYRRTFAAYWLTMLPPGPRRITATPTEASTSKPGTFSNS